MRKEPVVVRQFDDPVVSAARSLGLGGTLIYCQYDDVFTFGESGGLPSVGTQTGAQMDISIDAPATIFMHGQFNVQLSTLTPGSGFTEINAHLNPSIDEPGWTFDAPQTRDRLTWVSGLDTTMASFSWTGVTSRDPGSMSLIPTVSYASPDIDVDVDTVAITCFVSVIMSASNGSDCLRYSQPA